MEPKIPNKKKIYFKTCCKCGEQKITDDFIQTKNWFYGDGYSNICASCVDNHLKDADWAWDEVDKACQTFDIPFIPKKFEEIRSQNPEECFRIYAKFFNSNEYEELGWKDYYNKYVELKNKAALDRELPLVNDSYYEDLQLRWGANYSREQLVYLENLYNGLLSTQNVNGALQTDQAQKLCKISLNIDERIMANVDFDKLMSSYEKMTKIADFTPKNAKSDSDFSSMGEVVAWEEKRGWLNKWYDGANKDIVDEVIQSMQTFVQRLYINEPGIGEEVNERIQQLKIASDLDKKDADLEKKRLSDDPFFDIEDVNYEERDNKIYEDLILDEDVLDSKIMGV